MSRIYLVWARVADSGANTVLAAYAALADAGRHKDRATTRPWSERDNCETASPAELLGITEVWIEELPVRGLGGDRR